MVSRAPAPTAAHGVTAGAACSACVLKGMVHQGLETRLYAIAYRTDKINISLSICIVEPNGLLSEGLL